MDQRKEQLKVLKKAYKRRRRKNVGVWKTFAVIFLIIALIAACVIFVPLIPVMILVLILPEIAITFLVDNLWLLYALLGGGTALFLFCAILAGCGKRKLKKSSEYLDYRTLKTTLKAEKDAVK